ncbi:MAG: indolepyruvate ferredoxin oxidoreductase subunit alpha [Deltaproteobacteria bacterium]|nr:indolepyruvate ferredoxin oxidoreductase subunit alpha [Deltaproteobacteria bacterium]
MTHSLLSATAGDRLLLLGNEAIVRGALEAGVGFVSTYPGTPASEIGDTFRALAAEAGVVFEYSTNEKVALEVAAGPAAAGVRCLVAMKHVGLNVAADPLMTLAYVGVRGGMVIVTADDPGCHSSQNEQDNRYFAKLASLPMFDPSTPEEACAMTRAAFALSEAIELPVLLRTTTRVSHTRGAVVCGEKGESVNRGRFVKEPKRFVSVPAVARLRHPVLLQQFGKAAVRLADSPFNHVSGTAKSLGIVTSGVAACYVADAVVEMRLAKKVRVLKIGTPHPLPEDLCADFLGAHERVLVAEELEPFLEEKLKILAHERGLAVKIFGKASGHFPRLGEFDPDLVRGALADLLGLGWVAEKPAAREPAPARPPILCASCPHRSTAYLLKLAAGDDAVFMTDIGCYTLAFSEPLSIGDMCLCMGASITEASGLAAVSDQKTVALIGDSTFFHSGIAGLVNAVQNNRDLTVVVMDNGTTGMTGHQPHPGAMTGDGGERAVSIEEIARAAGVAHVAVVDPTDFGTALPPMREVMNAPGVGVIVARAPCPLYARKELGAARSG